MIDEIKKELLELNIHECDIEDIFEILDKYDSQPDYKSAWNDLKKVIWKLVDNEKREDKFWAKRELKNSIDDNMQELEQKYNLGGE